MTPGAQSVAEVVMAADLADEDAPDLADRCEQVAAAVIHIGYGSTEVAELLDTVGFGPARSVPVLDAAARIVTALKGTT